MARKIKKRSGPVSVFDAAQEYLISSAVKGLRPATQGEYEYKLTVFSRWCIAQKITLDDIDSKIMDAYLQYWRDEHTSCKPGEIEVSTNTLAGQVRVIKIFLNWCLLDDLYSSHVHAEVIKRIKKPVIIQPIIEIFTPKQVEALLTACAKEESEHLQVRDRAIIALLLDSGIRANELVTLKLGHVELDPKDSYIRVLGKGQKWGEVGLGEQARLSLKKYIRLFREPTVEHEVQQQTRNLTDRQLKQVQNQVKRQALCFVNRAGKPLTPNGLRQIIKRLARWADIKGVRCSPHTFRHTFAVLFWRKTHDIRTLSKLLRHSSIAVTETYLKSILQSEARIGAPSVLDDL
jgi:integrase/recombinase XerD